MCPDRSEWDYKGLTFELDLFSTKEARMCSEVVDEVRIGV